MLSKVLLVALIGLCITDKQFDLDSASAERASGSTQDWGGLQVAVFSDANDEPEIVLTSTTDNMAIKYCLTLEEIFETTEYDIDPTSDDFGDHSEVSNSEIDFQNDVTWTYTEGTDAASFALLGVPTDPNQDGDHSVFSQIEFNFRVAENPAVADGDYGVEYDFELTGYEWTSDDADAVLVLVFEFKSCDSEFESADFSDDGEDDNAEDDEEDDDRRRLGDDDDDDDEDEDNESDDGVSSDDSQEVDLGIGVFINHGDATCVNETEIIPTQVVYGGKLSSDEMHIVFQHFACSDIKQDPWCAILSGKRTESAAPARGYVLLYAVFIGVLVMMFV